MDKQPIPWLLLTPDTIGRFWVKVRKTEGCWIWTAASTHGYGVMFAGRRSAAGNKVPTRAHRISYQLAHGEIPLGLAIDHLCRNTLCVRPDHLEAVTQSENLRRGAKTGNNHLKTSCPQGHAYDEKNTRMYRGRRHCRACDRQRARDARDAVELRRVGA